MARRGALLTTGGKVRVGRYGVRLTEREPSWTFSSKCRSSAVRTGLAAGGVGPAVRIRFPPAASLPRTCRDRQVRSMPAFNLQAAFLLGLLARDMANRLAEGPDMALRIPSAISAVPIKLVGRLLKDSP